MNIIGFTCRFLLLQVDISHRLTRGVLLRGYLQEEEWQEGPVVSHQNQRHPGKTPVWNNSVPPQADVGVLCTRFRRKVTDFQVWRC
ncbi:hypothetical protein TNCV_2716561 [Trichonephila clavipes]|nr:hypothetical protein TNCV_2716561 [Trichonephila clavipes]